MPGFVGIHLGAGQHSDSLKQEYKKLISKACKKAVLVLNSGGSALTACTLATAVLEDSPLTNAGFGSNLTWRGEVECDASVMDGSSLHYGAVGAVSGVKNPVYLAQHLCEKQKDGLSCGRVPPCFLVGEGARLCALKAGIGTVPPKELISAKAWKLYQHYKRKVKRFQVLQNQQFVGPLDTVGAVCMDASGRVASACSSGGIALKTSGRVGQAAVYGSGCWAQDFTGTKSSVASCTSGCGEHLIRTIMARDAALAAQNNSCAEQGLHSFMKANFIESPFLRDVDEKLGGVIILKCNPTEGIGEFLWSHSTKTMCVGYMNAADSRPKCRVSSSSQGGRPGSTLVVEGIMFKCFIPGSRSISNNINLEKEEDSVAEVALLNGEVSIPTQSPVNCN